MADSQWGVGDAYEPYVGRWSRLVAREFLAWLAVPPGSHWLDVGCGTGALSSTVLDAHEPAEVVGVDQAAGFVAYAREKIADARARFLTGDARDLPVPDGAFDAVVSGLMLNFVPEPARAVAAMTRAARRGGTVGIYVWDYAGGMEMMRYFWDAAAFDPAGAALDEATRFAAVCSPDGLRTLCQQAGLADVATRGITVPTTFRDFDDYWRPFLGGQGAAPSYVATLDAARRDDLRERLRAAIPAAADGSIALTARAWAVRGQTHQQA